MPQKDNTPELVRIFPDQPVSTAEGLDFQFEGLARTLAELAWNPDNATPFTAVIRGGWGRGKTTLLRQTERLLRETKQGKGVRSVRQIWFNAWKYPSDDTVLAGLLGALLDEFRQGGLVDQVKFHVDSHKIRFARTVLHAAAPWAFGKPGEDRAWSGRYQPAEEKRAFNDLFRDLFVQASYLLFHGGAAIRDLDGRRPEDLWDAKAHRSYTLAIFLDDLDRCREERVLEVLEAINLFLDLPGVCFYLGLDMERLQALLPAHLEGHKSEFLEKIVQISLDLPEISHSGASGYVRTLVEKTPLRALLLGEGEQTWDDGAVIARVLGSRHPRHVKRFLNDLAMSLAVLRNIGHLGEGDQEHLPPRSVVAWHLLREALPEDKWREVRALTANLDAFLNQWRAAREAGEAKKGPEGWDEDMHQLARAGDLDAHIALLDALTPGQRYRLVHTGSPPRNVVTVPGHGEAVASAKGIGKAAMGVAPEWIDIPGGTFRMGSEQGSKDEKPVHEVKLAAFEIAKHPVTNAQYAAFVAATGVAPPRHWENGSIPEGKEKHPVVYVSWDDAKAYCDWLDEQSAQDGRNIGLLTEAQWEYAARGSAGREYPWGGEAPDKERCNFGGKVGDTTPVGAYPKGATPEGVEDLAGNVWEWTQDAWHDSYEGAPADGSVWESDKSGADRVVRGGSWATTRASAVARPAPGASPASATTTSVSVVPELRVREPRSRRARAERSRAGGGAPRGAGRGARRPALGSRSGGWGGARLPGAREHNRQRERRACNCASFRFPCSAAMKPPRS